MITAKTGVDELEDIISTERDGCNVEISHFEWWAVPEPALSDVERSKFLS
jgi:hypothetical protein